MDKNETSAKNSGSELNRYAVHLYDTFYESAKKDFEFSFNVEMILSILILFVKAQKKGASISQQKYHQVLSDFTWDELLDQIDRYQTRIMQFIYFADDEYVFMDPDNYDMIGGIADLLTFDPSLLKQGEFIKMNLKDGKPVSARK